MPVRRRARLKNHLQTGTESQVKTDQVKGKAEKDCSWGLGLDMIMRCRQWSFHASQLPGAPAAVLSADQ